MPQTDHPPREQLRDFLLGKLPDDSAYELNRHMEVCTTCEQALSSIEAEGDVLSSLLRQPESAEEFIAESGYRRAMEFIVDANRVGMPSQHEVGVPTSDAAADHDARPSLSQAVSHPAGESPKPVRLREYELLEKLGEGGMGSVFKARHVRLNKIVAVKVLRKDRMSAAAMARFEREMLAVGSLDHPNLIRAHDAGEVDGTHFLAIEYIAGSDVSHIAHRHGKLAIADACEIVRQAAVGLQYAHEHGLVHRDIKPGNLMLTHAGQVKVLDLGLALLQGQAASGGEELTGSGQIMGTVEYMAPEQVGDSHTVDIRADVYSLGATLYRLLAGFAPFAGPEYKSLGNKIVGLTADRPRPLVERRGDVPTALSQLVDRLLAKQPSERPATPAEVAEALAPFTTGNQVAVLATGEVPTILWEPGTASYLSASATSTQDSLKYPGLASVAHERDNEPALKGGRSRKHSLRILLAAGAAAFCFACFGVWVVVRDRDGNELGRIAVPDDGTATVTQTLLPSEEGARKLNEGETPTSSLGVSHPGSLPAGEEAASPNDYALRFDGESRVTIPFVAQTYDGWCVEAWVHPLPPPGRSTFASYVIRFPRLDKPHGFAIRSSGASTRTQWHFSSDGASPTAAGYGSVAWNTTQHVAATSDGVHRRFFVNGKLLKDELKKTAITPTDDGVALIGDGFVGRMEELRVSRVPRYTAEFIPQRRLESDADTSALYHFEEGEGDVLHDSSGNDRHGTIVGAKWVRSDGIATDLRVPQYALRNAAAPAIAPFDAAQAKAHQEAWAKYLGTTVETTNGVGMKMVLIPPGEFMMGSTDEQVEAALKTAEELDLPEEDRRRIRESERPQHRIVISRPFLIATTEVTIGQFRRFVDATQYVTEADQYGTGNSVTTTVETSADRKNAVRWQSPEHAVAEESAVTQVSWNDACAFCNWLSENERLPPPYRRNSTGRWQFESDSDGYRLPTEAEWEYACRAGTVTQFSFGDDVLSLKDYGWSNADARNNPQHLVGLLRANPFGLLDMHGNVVEWCQDCNSTNWYADSPTVDPVAPHPPASEGLTFSSWRILRGGNWYNSPDHCRSAARFSGAPTFRYRFIGFRYVRNLPIVDSGANAKATERDTTEPSDRR